MEGILDLNSRGHLQLVQNPKYSYGIRDKLFVPSTVLLLLWTEI